MISSDIVEVKQALVETIATGHAETMSQQLSVVSDNVSPRENIVKGTTSPCASGSLEQTLEHVVKEAVNAETLVESAKKSSERVVAPSSSESDIANALNVQKKDILLSKEFSLTENLKDPGSEQRSECASDKPVLKECDAKKREDILLTKVEEVKQRSDKAGDKLTLRACENSDEEKFQRTDISKKQEDNKDGESGVERRHTTSSTNEKQKPQQQDDGVQVRFSGIKISCNVVQKRKFTVASSYFGFLMCIISIFSNMIPTKIKNVPSPRTITYSVVVIIYLTI